MQIISPWIRANTVRYKHVKRHPETPTKRLSRYVFYDTWNFLDTSTICCILVAFIFRMIALDQNDEFFLFHAQFFYALSAPLLFSRLLVLSQIDATLGPMTQVSYRS